jgi:hypothetical protein
MKKITFFLLACCTAVCTFSQTTGRIDNLKDAWGTSYNYVGEIKNKQPNGLGVAIYSNNTALRYAGYFVNGQFNGKGALVFEDGSFLSGEWRNGKLEGKGANLSKEGDLYVGEFVNGKKEGKGYYIFNDKSFVVGSMKNDTYEGRCIFVNASGKTIADNIYANGKKNGTGYQYELASKQLFEGIWSGGNWVGAGTASYNSFLKDSRFYAEQTDNQILIGSINATSRKLEDTSFFYDLKKNERYFGYHEDGYLTDGVIVRDSSIFIGKSNDNGAYGSCSLYKTKKFYDEGIYANDYLSGSRSLSINLDKKTVYFGNTDQGYFSGKAWFVNSYNEIRNGSFEDGQFTGDGYIVYNTGKTVKGTFDDGRAIKVVSFADENGAPIDMKPKTFEKALNLIVSELANDLVPFRGAEDTTMYDDYFTAEKSIVSFPGSVGANYVFEDYSFYIGYLANFYQGNNFQAAKAQYDKLCRDIVASNISLKNSVPFRVGGTIEPAKETGVTRTKFSLPGAGLSSFSIYAELKNEKGQYKVNLVAGDVVYDDAQK